MSHTTHTRRAAKACVERKTRGVATANWDDFLQQFATLDPEDVIPGWDPDTSRRVSFDPTPVIIGIADDYERMMEYEHNQISSQ